MPKTLRRQAWCVLWLCAVLASAMTAAAQGAPPGRGYELVSPRDKNGGDVISENTRTRPAADGSAVQFGALEVFADAVGATVSTEYIAVRDARPGTQGWTTHGITPVQRPLTIADSLLTAFEPRYLGEMTGDLDAGVFLSNRLLTSAGENVALVPNLYLRSGLRSGLGASELMSDCPACMGPLPANNAKQPVPVGLSEDGRTVLFMVQTVLTADARGDAVPAGESYMKTYKWRDGTLSLVGVDETGAPTMCGAEACSFAGPLRFNGRVGGEGALSKDGARVVFSAPIAADARMVEDTRIFIRDDKGTSAPGDDETVEVSASEREPADAFHGARFWGASADGEVVFFTSLSALTDDAPVDPSPKLYRYTMTPDENGRHLTWVSRDTTGRGVIPNVEGVAGVSEGGDYVYFVAGGQIAAGGRSGCTGNWKCIFVWHEDEGGSQTLHEVAEIPGGLFAKLIVGDSDIFPKISRITPSGRHFVFITEAAPGLPGDHGRCPPAGDIVAGIDADESCAEVYVYSAGENGRPGTLQCASCPRFGSARANASFLADEATIGGAKPSKHVARPITDDGRYVFFTSGERLTPDDRNTQPDVYQYDTTTGLVTLISAGRADARSIFIDATPDGSDVFFTTRERLVGWDTDNSIDLYDARLGGGFPEPEPELAPCASEDSCRPAVGSQSPFGAPGSQLFEGPGNVSEGLGATPTFALADLSRRQWARLASGRPVTVRVRVSHPGNVVVRLVARYGKRVAARSARVRAHSGGVVRARTQLPRGIRRALRRGARVRVALVAEYSQSDDTQRIIRRLGMRQTRKGTR